MIATMGIAVTGAAGGLGANVVAAALRRGVRVRALARDAGDRRIAVEAERVVGDARDAAALTTLLDGCEALVHCVNVPFRADWDAQVSRMLDVAIEACRARGARLVFPGNVWVFGRGRPGDLVDESRPFAPISRKGRVRARSEEKLAASGVRFVTVRIAEFYGPHVTTLLGPPLRALTRGGKARWFGPRDVTIELAYMPDSGACLVEAALAAGVDGETFHLPTAGGTTPGAFFDLARRVAGGGRAVFTPGWVVRLAGAVSREAREFADILHLWEDPIVLDGSKWRGRFQTVPSTGYEAGIGATLDCCGPIRT